MRTTTAQAFRTAPGNLRALHDAGLIASRCAQLGIDYRTHHPAPLGQRRRVLEQIFA